MYLYVADESLCVPHFFLFGGITVDPNIQIELLNSLQKIRNTPTSVKLAPNIEIKWNYQPNKVLISDTDHTNIKNDILELIARYNKDQLGIFIYIVPYERFLNNGWLAYQYAMNVCFNKFEDYLVKKNTAGIVLIDEFQAVKTKNINGRSTVLTKDDLRGHLEVFIQKLYNSGTDTKLLSHIPLIIPNMNSSISPLHQINDIILGSFQYYILKVMTNDPARRLAAANIRKYISNFHTTSYISKDRLPVFNSGVSIYPLKQKDSCDAKIPTLVNALIEDFKFI